MERKPHTADDTFTVITKHGKDDATGSQRGGRVRESFQAANIAEDWLLQFGVPGISYAELVFNGDDEPHTMMFLLEKDEIGIWNTPSCSWPVYYPPTDQRGTMLAGLPWPELTSEGEEDAEAEANNVEGGAKQEDKNADVMDLGMDDAAEEDHDDEEDDDTPDDLEDGLDEEVEDGVDNENEDGDSDPQIDDETEQEEEEMPRLEIFAKLRGPRGWRKRATAEELEQVNTFAMKVGVLPPEDVRGDLTNAQQEREVFVHAIFTERDDDRMKGKLKLRLPEGITLDDFRVTGPGTFIVDVPYPREDRNA